MGNVELARYGEENFFADILRILSEGRNKARAAVNLSMVETYWAIGRRIVEQEQQGRSERIMVINCLLIYPVIWVAHLARVFLLQICGILGSFILHGQTTQFSTQCVEN